MNELEINYGFSKSRKGLLLAVGGYFALYGLYQGVMLALANLLNMDFYMAVIAVILGAMLILSVTLWAPKPMFKVDTESIYINMPAQKTVYTAEWIAIKELSIGISYLIFAETDGKSYNVDISSLKYNDLKDVKSKIIEICEAKSIPYRND